MLIFNVLYRHRLCNSCNSSSLPSRFLAKMVILGAKMNVLKSEKPCNICHKSLFYLSKVRLDKGFSLLQAFRKTPILSQSCNTLVTSCHKPCHKSCNNFNSLILNYLQGKKPL